MPGMSGIAAMSVTSGVVPGRARPWPGSGGLCLSDSMAQAEQLALDSAVSPSRVLPGQVQDQVADLLRDGRTSSPARVGPFPFDQTTVPASKVPGVTIR